MITIYALYTIEEDGLDIRYIGQTKNFKNRIAQWRYQINHLDNERERGPKFEWVKTVIFEKQKELQFLIIDQVEDSEGDLYEQHYISLFRSWGFELLNSQNGGRKGFNLNKKQRDYISLKQKERTLERGGFFKGHTIQKKTRKNGEKRL